MLRKALYLVMMLMAVPNLASAYNYWSISATTSPAGINAAAIARPANAVAPALGYYTAAGSTTTNVTDPALTSADFTVAAPAGYTLAYVVIDGVKTAPVAADTYRVNKGSKIYHTLSAVYSTQKFSVTTSKTGNGYIDPTSQVAAGSSKSIKVMPGAGYKIAAVAAGDAVLSAGDGVTAATYTFANVQANKTISADFVAVPVVDAKVATSSQTISTGSALVIDGTTSTSSVAASYVWSVAPATGATITPAADGKTATFSATAGGSYVITLALSAADATPDTASVTISVASQGALENNQCTVCHNDRTPAVIAAYNAGSHGTTASSCKSCHNGDHGTVRSNISFGSISGAVVAPLGVDNYVGSAVCNSCHSDKYATFIKSGHNFKMSKVVDGQMPTFPFSSLEGALENMPDYALAGNDGSTVGAVPVADGGVYRTKPASYDEVSYVVGGYGWKARWFYADGYIASGTKVQYNINAGPSDNPANWGDYKKGPNKKYDCGECHTTGWKYSLDNHQDGLVGIKGTWVESGVQCESCHGAGKLHAMSGDKADIAKVSAPRTKAQLEQETGYGLAVTCGECHTRDGERNYKNGYTSAYNTASGNSQIGGRIISGTANGVTLGNHHQTYDELLGINPDEVAAPALGKHLKAGVSCGACHDPHKTTIYQNVSNDGLGVDVACTSCHEMTFTATGAAHANADCIACHMPKLTKSAITTGTNAAGKTLGDIKTHIFKIDLSRTDQFTSTTGAGFTKPWITPDYACGSCHGTPATKVANLNSGFGGRIHGTNVYSHTVSTIAPTGDSCVRCHNGANGEASSKVSLPDETTPAATPNLAGEYIGSGACRSCHADQYTTFVQSGHNFKMNKVVDGQVPSFPFSTLDPSNNGVGVLANMPATATGNTLGKPTSYDQVSYVVGGYGWKARWFDLDGYIVTNSTPSTGNVQYNLADGSWSAYGGTNKKYDCGECHTTGWKYSTTEHQDGLPGMYGTWTMPGVQCEACHGAAAEHAATGSAADITRVAPARTEAQLLVEEGYGLAVHCGECHTRDGERNSYGGSGSGSVANGNPYKSAYNKASGTSDTIGGRIIAGGNLGNHHQAYDELLGVLPADYDLGAGTVNSLTAVGKHLPAGVSCDSCHNPHKTTKYQDHPNNTAGPGVDVACNSCHATKTSFTVGAHTGLACISCHMPQMTKSAISTGVNLAGKTLGDIKTHVFKIKLDAPSQFVTPATQQYMYPFVTKDYACGSCHAVPADNVNTLNSTYGGKIHP